VAEAAVHYGPARESKYLTVEEYFALEESSDVRYEYVAGEIFAMSGATSAHNTILLNIGSAFKAHLRGGPCRAYVDSMKVHLRMGRKDVFYYPDVTVFCGNVDPKDRFIETPKLIVEVLSPATERIDRTEKAVNYRQIDALEEYVLVAQEQQEVTVYRREDDWRPQIVRSSQGTVLFRSIELELEMQLIYEQAL